MCNDCVSATFEDYYHFTDTNYPHSNICVACARVAHGGKVVAKGNMGNVTVPIAECINFIDNFLLCSCDLLGQIKDTRAV